MNKRIFVTLSLLAILFSQISLAQENQSKPAPVEIFKKDGEVLKGKILGIKKDTLEFRDADGSIQRIAMKEVRNIDYVDSARIGKDWFEHTNKFRYLFTNPAIPLKKNEIQFGGTYGIITTIQYGLTKRVSIGGGAEIFGGSVSFLNAKVNILNQPKHKLSTGLHYYRLPPDFLETLSGEDHRNLILLSAASTWGNENNHFTVGAGYMYIFKGFLPPTVTVSGTVRLIERLSLVTENWFLFVGQKTNLPVLISLGVRYLHRRGSIDFALFSDDDSRFGEMFPYVAYSSRLGRVH
jgi:hypothetical protein